MSNAYFVLGKIARMTLNGSRPGEVVLDASDIERVIACGSWHMNSHGKIVVSKSGRRNQKIYLHRFILRLKNHQETVDFLDSDHLNFRKKNLIKMTVPRRERKRGSGGVSWNSERQKWRAHPFINGKRVSLGYFDTEEEARAAVLAARPENPDRGIYFDKHYSHGHGRYRLLVAGNFLGGFKTIEEAREKRDAYERGEWKPLERISGLSWCSEHQKWRANGRFGKYLGRFTRREDAKQAIDDYNSKAISAASSRRDKKARRPRTKKG